LIQWELSYLTEPRRICKYHRYGRLWLLQNLHQFHCAHVGPEQFDYDNRYFFGALMYIFKVEPKGGNYFNQAKREDGIRMYSTFVQHRYPSGYTKFGGQQDSSTIILLKLSIRALGFLHYLENAHATLSHLGKEADKDKFEYLEGQTPYRQYIISDCYDHPKHAG
jgi:hypothetical protein